MKKDCIMMETKANTEEKAAKINILLTISASVRGPLTTMSLTKVEGAFLSLEAIILKSSVMTVGLLFTSLCSTIFLTLDKNKKEFITAGKRAITPIISEFPTIAKAPYIEPRSNVPESPGKILLGIL